MKIKLPALFIFIFYGTAAIAQDLPSPSSNLQLLPRGSYVIAMDNTYQGDGTLFNLNSYGLIVDLLNNSVKLKWVIKSGKTKGETDFKVNSTRVVPGTGITQSRDFKSGPFVIFKQDAVNTDIPRLVTDYNSTLPPGATPVKLFITNADATVDIRYDLSGFIPKAAILTDGQNAAIHQAYFQVCHIPAGNYSTSTNAAGLASGCYTFASEPHYDTQVDGDPTVVVNNIRAFLLRGGNFLAQCHAVDSYENNSNGHFMATGNINGTGNCMLTNSCRNFNNSFPNADLGFAQIMGNYSMNLEGHTQEWKVNGTWKNDSHVIVRSSDNTAEVGAMVSKLVPANLRGGMVFYLGNHTFMHDISTQAGINGIRMYMNAFLTPTNPAGSLNPVFATRCLTPQSPTTSLTLVTQKGFTNLYPLAIKFYVDKTAPFGVINSGDIQMGQLTITAPVSNSIVSTVPPAYRQGYRYLVSITTASACLAPIVLSVNSCNTNLPVLLQSFTAARNRDKPEQVQLRWTTETEDNCEGFEIQLSRDNITWEKAGYLNTQAPGGNSTQTLQYAATGYNTAGSTTYYRLKQWDKDGQYTLSSIIAVPGLNSIQTIHIYPNPASNGSVTVELDKPVSGMQLLVSDVSGRVLRQVNNITERTIKINGLRSGLYFIKISTPQQGIIYSEKIISGN